MKVMTRRYRENLDVPVADPENGETTARPVSILDVQVLPEKIYIFIRSGEIKSEQILEALNEYGIKGTIEHFKSPCG